ncbi:hypothetical protein BDZ88DRAFT_132819 [Geranomyces variabilis]|nr:hypothetical protein BDZ88DRAFT_132819 [Geranomyces variabilis]
MSHSGKVNSVLNSSGSPPPSSLNNHAVHRDPSNNIRRNLSPPLSHSLAHRPKSGSFTQGPEGLHFGLFTSSTSTSPASVISLFLEPNSQGARFRKFATAAKVQGKGYRSKLLDHMLTEAVALGVGRIWCTARKSFSRAVLFGMDEWLGQSSRGQDPSRL